MPRLDCPSVSAETPQQASKQGTETGTEAFKPIIPKWWMEPLGRAGKGDCPCNLPRSKAKTCKPNTLHPAHPPHLAPRLVRNVAELGCRHTVLLLVVYRGRRIGYSCKTISARLQAVFDNKVW